MNYLLFHLKIFIRAAHDDHSSVQNLPQGSIRLNYFCFGDFESHLKLLIIFFTEIPKFHYFTLSILYILKLMSFNKRIIKLHLFLVLGLA